MRIGAARLCANHLVLPLPKNVNREAGMNAHVCKTSVAVLFIFINSAQASEISNGPNGINSIATGLLGANSSIGQVEPGRPGKFGYDTEANCCNDKVVPV